MLRTRGDGFLRKLKKQNVRMHMMAGSALTQIVAAGEIFGSPSQFYSATNVADNRGAPVVWVPMDIVVTNAEGAAVYANASRPNAALLFADFLLSPEGQKLLEELYFGSPQKDYGFRYGPRYHGSPPPAVFVDHPVGRTFGPPQQRARNREILTRALTELSGFSRPGEIRDLGCQWELDGSRGWEEQVRAEILRDKA